MLYVRCENLESIFRLLSYGAVLLCLVFAIGCGQNVDDPEVIPNDPPSEPAPPPYNQGAFFTNIETQGGSSSSAVGASRALTIQSFGGTHVRTFSTSTSFRMTSGIGVD